MSIYSHLVTTRNAEFLPKPLDRLDKENKAIAICDVNAASREELIALEGVGEELADAIIAARPFNATDDLVSISGIGRTLLERLKEQGVAVVQRPSFEFEQERRQFRSLIMANPNYFGNLKLSPYTPVADIQVNSHFEEIGCVGFQPQFDRLDAVVYVNQPSGYGGEICSNGAPEYVRFYISYDNGTNWSDLGLTSFTAYDILEGTRGDRRLEYDATLVIDPYKTLCFIKNIAKVRAILSWNVPPPPNDPDYPPVWGDIHDTYIKIDPRKFVIFGDILKATETKLTPELASVIDLEQEIPTSQPKEMSLAERQEFYKDKGVPAYRYALPELHRIISNPTLSESLMAPGAESVLAPFGIDFEEIGDLLNPTDGNTFYEELECVGLNPNQDTLAGIIRVKRDYGYGGSLCKLGSKEYVTFWADFNKNGFFEACLGTT